jgi:hypothetical protein
VKNHFAGTFLLCWLFTDIPVVLCSSFSWFVSWLRDLVVSVAGIACLPLLLLDVIAPIAIFLAYGDTVVMYLCTFDYLRC